MRTFITMLSAMVLLTTSCRRDAVSLAYTNATNEVPVLGNLTFRFSSALATDSMLNRWDSTGYIKFEPAIAGRFRWEAKDQLVFSPASPLLPATSYKADFSSKTLLQHSDFKKLDKTGDVKFRTPDLQVERQYFSWAKAEGTNAISPKLELLFNYPVSPEALKQKLKVLVDESSVPFQFETMNTASSLKLVLQGLSVEDRDYKINITVQQGLVPDGGKNGLDADKTYSTILPSPFVLLVNEVTTEHDGTNGTIFVRTNQAITGAVLAPLIDIKPAVKYTAEPTDNGLLITGAGFDVNNSYTLILKTGLKGSLGGSLKEPYQADLTFGEMEPSLSFANNKAVYLSAAGQRNIELRITNVPKIKLIVSKVYESNLLATNKYGYYPKEKYDDDDYYYEGNDDVVMGDIILEQEIDTRTLPMMGGGRLLHFNPDDKLPGYKGIYHIKVRSTEDYWISDSRFIALSDIGLIAKGNHQKMLVFANSIHSATGMSGVGVQVYGNNNQLMGSGSTNSNGVAEIVLNTSEFSGFKPGMIIAKSGDDFNYLPFNNTKVNTSRYAVGGKRINSTGLDAYIIPERDIYRPGENIRFAAVVRDANRKSPGELPVKIKMLLPNGKELTQLRKTLDSEGVTDASISLQAAAVTGSYLMELYNGNDVLLTTQNFRVEDFVPDRIKVTATLANETLRPGTTTSLGIAAVNYFGPPAAGRKYEMEIQVKEKPFRPDGFNNYNFTLANGQRFFDKILKEGKTDEQGNAAESFTVPAAYNGLGLLQARFFATVFDETGRPVSRNTIADIVTQDVLLGIGGDGYNYYSLNQPAKFALVALNAKGQVASSKAQVSVIKHEYRTVLRKSGGYFRYDSQKEEKQLQTKDINIQGSNTAFSFIPREAGEYELRVALPGSDTYVSRQFYSYGSWSWANSAFEVNTNGEVDIALDKTEYQTGDKVKALFKAPFDGRLLVTIETNEVLSHEVVEVKNKAASIDLPLTEAHLPNAYITATLFKPHTPGSNIPLTVAHGFANIAVTDASKRMAVSIAAATTSRSERKQKITVKASPGAMVNLAAADNGILAVTGFKTPDPYTWYFSKRALGVEAWDLYPLLFPELRRTLSSTGGDGDLSMNLRQNPITSKRFKLMSYWSGWRKAGGNGEVSFDLDIPAFNGQVRLMAVGVSGDKFGAAEATMQVADPLVISTAMPRFITPGDTVMVGVTLSNTTAKAATVTAKISTAGPLHQGEGVNLQASIAANSEGRIEFPVYAQPQPGSGTLTVVVNGMGESFKEVIDISVRPASTLQRRSGSGIIAASGKKDIQLPVNDFMQPSISYNLMIGRSPVLQLGTQLSYLVNYPHGCTEQTISAAFPQLYFTDLSNLMQSGQALKGAAAGNIATAIQKIKMRQLYNGGLTMWEYEGTESWWTTAYAAHFLIEARKAGYAPDASLIETMLQYLTHKLRKKDLVDYYYNQSQQKKIAPKEVAYSLYVLALAGKPNVAGMNYYKANQKDLALDSRYLLSAAYALSGDKKSFAALLPASFAGEESLPVNGGSFYSPIRDEGLALSVLLEADPSNAQIPVMARHLVDKLNARSHYSTQEAVFSLLALGKLAKQSGATTATAEVTVGGKKVGAMTGEPLKLNQKQLGGTNIAVQSKGTGNLYYWWQANGISSTGQFKEEDNYLKVRRQLYDRYGRALSGNQFKQNDLIVVKLVLEKAFNGAVDNVVVTDLLPGGFEIENSRIRDLPGMDWIKDENTPLSRDIRDDRIHLFTDLRANRQVFYYSVRAVTPGTYRIGPLSADAMYNGEYHSYSGSGTISVLR